MVVTATGMSSEVGHISGMLSGVEQEKSPLTKQLDQLTVIITIMAAAALALIIILGLARGEDFDSLFLTGITLAIAAIPTGLPAVVTMLLSVGTQELAEQGSHRQAVEVGRDARLHVGDLLRQDGHAHAEPDDGARARDRRPPLQRRRRGLLDDRSHPARGGHQRQPARAVHAADGAGQRRRHPRRGVHRRPDRGRTRRAGGQGRDRRRGHAQGLSPRCRGALRRRVQADGDVPRDGRRRPEGRALLRQGSARRLAVPLVALSGCRRIDGADGRLDRSGAGRERPAGSRRHAGAGGRQARLRPGVVRPGGRPAGAGQPSWSCSPSSASSTRRARKPRMRSPSARTPASASA